MGLGNKLIVSATGFPGTNKTLRFIQDAFREPLGALAQMAGEKTIITGVVNTAGVVSDGFIVYQNEIIPFKGGAFANTVTIFEAFENVDYNTDINNDTVLDSLPAYRTIYAKCGTGGIDIFNFSELFRLRTLKDLQPIGTIQMWGGEIGNIPSGWKLCNGNDGTPNLIDRFIVGAGGIYNVGDFGGLNSVQLSVEQMASHSHNGTTQSAGSHNHSISINQSGSHTHSGHVIQASGDWKGGGNNSAPNSTSYPGNVSTSGLHTHTANIANSGVHNHNFSTDSIGGNEAHENRPPYYALCYIMYLGI
ncbi:hypothetical protein [Flavobacterium sasangense]|uniref:hypothetical protein n=1 Tax=Flavobacterium sasangense TaxID=503361 RepID=UPI00047970FD|nr:hypothetical protein [Flavobacterium sasangense]